MKIKLIKYCPNIQCEVNGRIVEGKRELIKCFESDNSNDQYVFVNEATRLMRIDKYNNSFCKAFENMPVFYYLETWIHEKVNNELYNEYEELYDVSEL